jgi:uncharacterized cupin superfamily protein
MMKVWHPTPKEIENTNGWGIWTKEISEFDWYYDQNETCYILEGEVEVFDNNGQSIHFGVGDMVEFRKGLSCKWKIKSPVKKRYLFS